MSDNINIYMKIYIQLTMIYGFVTRKLWKDKFISSIFTINGIVKSEIKKLENLYYLTRKRSKNLILIQKIRQKLFQKC